MADPNKIVAKFEADVTNLQAGTAKASNAISGVQQGVAKTAKTTADLQAEAGRHFAGVAAAAGAIVPFMDQTTGAMVSFGAMGVGATKAVQESIVALGATFKASLVGAIGIGIVALSAFISHLLKTEKQAEDTTEAQKKLAEAIASIKAITGPSLGAFDSFQNKIQELALRISAFQDRVVDVEEYRKFQDELRDVIVKLTIAKARLEEKGRSLEAGSEAITEYYVQLAKLSDSLQTTKEQLEDVDATIKRLEPDVRSISDVFPDAADKMDASMNKLNAEFDAYLEKQVAIADSVNVWKIMDQQLVATQSTFLQWVAAMGNGLAQLYTGIMDLSRALTSGLGNAFAQALVYGAEWGETMQNMLKGLLAQIVSFFVQWIVQQTLFLVFSLLGLVKKTSAELASAAGLAGAWAYVASVRELGLVGIAAGPGFAAAAISGTLGSAAAGAAAGKGAGAALVPAFAEGGGMNYVPGGALVRVAEREKEYMIPHSDYQKLIGARGGDIHVALNADGRKLAEVVVPNIPNYVRRRGIKGL